MTSILQAWVTNLGLRHQGILVSSIRGCDTVAKHCALKELNQIMRGYILVPFSDKPSSYIAYVGSDKLKEVMKDVLYEDIDHLPHHYVMHLIHAVAILGYYSEKDRYNWNWFYLKLCSKLHLGPESLEQLDRRLFAKEDDFARSQE